MSKSCTKELLRRLELHRLRYKILRKHLFIRVVKQSVILDTQHYCINIIVTNVVVH